MINNCVQDNTDNISKLMRRLNIIIKVFNRKIDELFFVDLLYTLTDEGLKYTQLETPAHSAARAITNDGYATLLYNLSYRYEMPIETQADIDAILARIQ